MPKRDGIGTCFLVAIALMLFVVAPVVAVQKVVLFEDFGATW
jgi:hypothetical protein